LQNPSKGNGADLNNVRCETTELPGTNVVIYEFKTNNKKQKY
jgi:hypothetical protein